MTEGLTGTAGDATDAPGPAAAARIRGVALERLPEDLPSRPMRSKSCSITFETRSFAAVPTVAAGTSTCSTFPVAPDHPPGTSPTSNCCTNCASRLAMSIWRWPHVAGSNPACCCRVRRAADEPEDPRAELVRRLQEYERYRRAAGPRRCRAWNAMSSPRGARCRATRRVRELSPHVELGELLGACAGARPRQTSAAAVTSAADRCRSARARRRNPRARRYRAVHALRRACCRGFTASAWSSPSSPCSNSCAGRCWNWCRAKRFAPIHVRRRGALQLRPERRCIGMDASPVIRHPRLHRAHPRLYRAHPRSYQAHPGCTGASPVAPGASPVIGHVPSLHQTR